MFTGLLRTHGKPEYFASVTEEPEDGYGGPASHAGRRDIYRGKDGSPL
jgi:hypothetical protein